MPAIEEMHWMNQTELRKLLSQEEGMKLDFKTDLRQDNMADLSKDFAAFANTEGGHIIIGVSNDRQVLGLDASSEKIASIHQEALTCVPPVTIKVSEEVLNKKKLILIEITKSNWIHRDKYKRFPQRFGAKTDFMETHMILSLAKVRGLISGETQSANSHIARKSPKKQHSLLVDLLSNHNAIIRKEALSDLENIVFYIRIEDIPKLFEKVLSLLKDRESQIQYLALNIIDRLDLFISDKKRRQYMPRMIPEIIDRSLHDDDFGVRRKAVYLLLNSGDPRCIDTIVEIITREPKETYDQIKPEEHAIRVVEKGLGHEMRARLYSELSKVQEEEIQTRIVKFLSAMRNVRWHD